MEVVTDLKKCPWCGEENAGVMSKLVQEEVSKGNMGEGSIGGIATNVYVAINPLKPPIAGGRTRAVRAYVDICTKCGRDYNFRVETGWAILPTRPGVAPTFA